MLPIYPSTWFRRSREPMFPTLSRQSRGTWYKKTLCFSRPSLAIITVNPQRLKNKQQQQQQTATNNNKGVHTCVVGCNTRQVIHTNSVLKPWTSVGHPGLGYALFVIRSLRVCAQGISRQNSNYRGCQPIKLECYQVTHYRVTRCRQAFCGEKQRVQLCPSHSS